MKKARLLKIGCGNHHNGQNRNMRIVIILMFMLG